MGRFRIFDHPSRIGKTGLYNDPKYLLSKSSANDKIARLIAKKRPLLKRLNGNKREVD
jgi:hypothetical protein